MSDTHLRSHETLRKHVCRQFIEALLMQPPVESTKPQLLQVENISSLKTAVPEGMMKASIIKSLGVVQIMLREAPIIQEEWRSGM